ncbi:DUF58 domain-containing protein [Haladaptatus sp. DYSN1]|uniref:DUF58 domain-containing protein n=1 Tax=unclassified Haladaptatus TaxID=2622732 RepID=UPI0024064012|nr:DUF58 domain-containing protein [Haladaptatus sp. DYSN1]
MSLTRRGYVVVGVCALSLAMAFMFGSRALNAVVVPAAVALVAGAIQSMRLPKPDVTRSQPAPGFPGETRSVTLSFEGTHTASASVEEGVGEGLATDHTRFETSVPGTLTYDVEYTRRGEHELGPVTVAVRDMFGLFERTFEYPLTTKALVYPRLEDLSDDARHALNLLFDEMAVVTRQEFDNLREYVPGDPLRDIHWKTSAKRDGDLLVAEFIGEAEEDGLSIVAEGDAGKADEMACAAASVATYIIDAGLACDVTAPGGRVSRARGDTQRNRVLTLFAQTPAGRVATTRREMADVHIFVPSEGETTVRLRDREVTFTDLTRGTAVAADGGRVEP